MRRTRSLVGSLVLSGMLVAGSATAGSDVILSAQGEYLDAYLTQQVGAFPPGRYAFVVPDDPAHGGRHLNGNVCFFPSTYKDKNGFTHTHPRFGQFVEADDTFDEACNATLVDDADVGNPNHARCAPAGAEFVGNDPAGWGVMNPDGSWGRKVIHTVGCGAGGQGGPCDNAGASLGTIDPQGCLFDQSGNLWGTDVGADGDFTNTTGSLIIFFADGDYDDYCVVLDRLPSPAMPGYDGWKNVLLPLSGGGTVLRLTDSLPFRFPTSRADCPGADHQVKVPPLVTVFTIFPLSLTATPSQIVRKPNTNHWYMSSVLIFPGINEYTNLGLPVALAVAPFAAKNPIGLDVGRDGTIYFSELNLQNDAATQTFFQTGCGSVSRAKPGQTPVQMSGGLRFPDGIKVVDSDLLDLSGLQPPLVLDPNTCAPE